ncbi:transcriptional regulator LysR family [Photobacterium aphoticum]|uniref:Transcriptional regulator LysR family n=1 Tax=Photobacterium aphoticum TaxID=754436 RepID=A0A090QZ05_9GAMM|nr:transcriptional regulator LysR family [Photobacterium aphoticum]
MNTNKLIALMPELAVFKIVVDEGSFTAAAKKLGVTPSALSKQLSRLEHTLSAKLLERTTRKLVITESGKGFITSAVPCWKPPNKRWSSPVLNMPCHQVRSRSLHPKHF